MFLVFSPGFWHLASIYWHVRIDLTRRGNSITYTCECDLICRQEKRLDDPSSNSCTLVVVQMSQQDRGLGSVRLKFVSKRPWWVHSDLCLQAPRPNGSGFFIAFLLSIFSIRNPRPLCEQGEAGGRNLKSAMRGGGYHESRKDQGKEPDRCEEKGPGLLLF